MNGPSEPQPPGPGHSTLPPPSHRRARLLAGVAAAAVVALAVLLFAVNGPMNRPGSTGTAETRPSPTRTVPTSPASPDAKGVIRANVSPLDFNKGDCMRDYDGKAPRATLVSCTTPHSAQLVNTFYYGADDSYPGPDSLKGKGQEVCRAAALTDAAKDYDLRQVTAYPAEATWQKGDRRVDCFVVVGAGDPITRNLAR
ncbi:septum formation family protein [Paenarthrobacter sp. DKR-5]|uniref:septum formation family protein n=1 Tax=Paenarthrobacter sp. DKR-5 TaxID=2835535 RepID=UPI001BDD5467|nr:septum formation family protein [Paenarthrobacter sp. DKR-5]MBT1001370.1 septum formation family protein [Paenarthrobacter sp. DKR-5]